MSDANKLKTVLKSVNNLYGMAFNLVHILTLTMSVLPQLCLIMNWVYNSLFPFNVFYYPEVTSSDITAHK